MCRLLGRVSTELITDSDLIGADDCQEFQRLGRLHADGWGTAWLTEDGPGGIWLDRLRDPGDPTTSTDLTGALTRTPTRARITHLRLATEGLATQLSNTHPFLVDGIAFAHNGSVPVGPLRELVSAEELDEIGGTTDSAMMFALMLRRHREGAPLFDAATEVSAELRRRFPQAAVNLLLLSAAELIAVNANAGAAVPYEDFAASGLGEDLPADHLDDYYRLAWRRTEAGVVVSSSGLSADGWTPMAQHTAARVDLTSLAMEIRPIEGPPVTSRSDAA